MTYRMMAIGCAAAVVQHQPSKSPEKPAALAFLRSRTATPLDAGQCECLAKVGRKAIPDIREHAYSRRSTIQQLLEHNPVMKAVLASECKIERN